MPDPTDPRRAAELALEGMTRAHLGFVAECVLMYSTSVLGDVGMRVEGRYDLAAEVRPARGMTAHLLVAAYDALRVAAEMAGHADPQSLYAGVPAEFLAVVAEARREAARTEPHPHNPTAAGLAAVFWSAVAGSVGGFPTLEADR